MLLKVLNLKCATGPMPLTDWKNNMHSNLTILFKKNVLLNLTVELVTGGSPALVVGRRGGAPNLLRSFDRENKTAKFGRKCESLLCGQKEEARSLQKY